MRIKGSAFIVRLTILIAIDVSTAHCRSSSGDDDDLQCAVETLRSISK